MVFSLFAMIFKGYRTATAVSLLSRPERIIWDIVFFLLMFTFVLGLYKLTVNSYRSFIRVFFDVAKTQIFDQKAEKPASANK